MKKSVLVACLGLGVFIADASAADFSAKGSLTETVEGSDNYFLLNTPSGTTFKSLSAVNLDFLARTPTTRYLLDTNLSYYKYFGAGAADTALTHGMPADATFRIDHTTELAKYNLATSWSRQDLASTLLTQTGVASAVGTQDTFKINGGVSLDLTRKDSIVWSAQASTASYTDSTQTPYKDVTTTLAWNRLLSSTTTLNNSVMFDWFAADDTADSQRLFWQIMTGVTSQLSRRLTINASAGEVFANAYQSGGNVSPGTTSFQVQPGAAHDWVANVGLKYQLLKTTSVSLTAAQTVAPTILGNLQKSDTVGVSLSHDINEFSNLTFSSNVAHTNSLGTEGNFFSAQVAYGYKLTREWRTRLSYTYNQSIGETTGLARSNTILLSLTRDFTLLGNPTAIDEAEQARKQEREQRAVGEVFPNLR